MFAEFADGLQGASHRELTQLLVDIRLLKAKLSMMEAAVVAQVDTTRSYVEDGQHLATAWIRSTTLCSVAESRRVMRQARLLNAHPEIAEALVDGRMPECSVDGLARVFSNPRVRDQFAADVPSLIEEGVHCEFDDFHTRLRTWEHVNDVDGSHREHNASSERRYASVSTVFEETQLHATIPGLAGIEVEEILDRFKHAELLVDVAIRDRLAELGSTDSALPRTAAQRAADALVAIFRTAANAEPGVVSASEPMVYVVVDQQTIEEQLARYTGHQPAAIRTSKRRICQTRDGRTVAPAEAFDALLRGKFRRVVYDSAGVVLEMGRRQRFFTGPIREAVMLQGCRCTWAGCRNRVSDADHLVDFANDGNTDSRNGGPSCHTHNLRKNHGFTVQRDETRFGHYTVRRPDGTRIIPTRAFAPPKDPDLADELAAIAERIGQLPTRAA